MKTNTQATFKCDDFAYSLASMLDANQDDAEVCEWLNGAKIGDEITFGGGAMTQTVIKRLS
jgi:hypothetical protein